MKKLMFLIFLLTVNFVFCQSLYRPCTSGAKNLSTEKGRFRVEIRKSLYGLEFEKNNPCLTDVLKRKIEKLAKQPFFNVISWDKKHTAKLEIIWKTNGKYYLYLPDQKPNQIEL